DHRQDGCQIRGPRRLRCWTGRWQVCNTYYVRGTQPITEALLQAIAASRMSFNALERETGVKRQSLMKFVRREQSLRGDVMDKLAAFFKMELRTKRKGK